MWTLLAEYLQIYSTVTVVFPAVVAVGRFYGGFASALEPLFARMHVPNHRFRVWHPIVP